MRMTETVEFNVILRMNGSGVEDLYINWYVTATARVRFSTGSFTEPPELLVEDYAIEDVRASEIHVGAARFDIASSVVERTEREYDAAQIDWLNDQIDDQDDWRDLMEKAAIAEFHKRSLVAA